MLYSTNHHSNHWMAQLNKYYEASSARKKAAKQAELDNKNKSN